MADTRKESSATDSRTLAFGALALAVVLFLSIIIFSESVIKGVRLDLTEKSLFTLSDGTKKTLSTLDEEITLRFFSTRKLVETTPGLTAYGTRVQELLERYASLAGGKLRLELVNPEPFSPEEDRAVGFGLSGIPITEAGDLGYFGIAATNSTDDTDVLAFLTPQRERFLEYDLTRMIHNLGNPKKKVIALVSGIPVDSDPLKQYKPWALIDNLKQFFEVRAQGLTPKLTDDVDLVMIVHPFGLSEESRYQIDQFVLRGGNAVVFVDPHAEEGARSNAALRLPPGVGSDLPELLKAWGVKYDKDKVLGDLAAGTRVQAGTDSLGRPIITRYIAWTSYGPENIDTGDVIASELQKINFATPGFLEKAEGATTQIEPLIWSSKSAGPFDAESVRRDPKPADILRDFKPQDKSYIIAARVSGKVKSAFPDGPPKSDDADKKDAADEKDGPAPKPHLAESADDINVVVVADTDILADSFWLRAQDLFGQQVIVPIAHNADLVVNAADNMAGTSALISLRGRGLSSRPFDVVESIQREAEDKYMTQAQALAKELEDVEKKLRELQTTKKAAGAAVMSKEQDEEVRKFRARVLEIRTELREVQLNLRRDIDQLGSDLKLLNIAAVPAAIAIFAVGISVVRRNRTRARAGT